MLLILPKVVIILVIDTIGMWDFVFRVENGFDPGVRLSCGRVTDCGDAGRVYFGDPFELGGAEDFF